MSDNVRCRKLPALLTGAFILALAGSLGSEEALELDVFPRLSPAPAEVRVSVGVEPDPENRMLRVEADSGRFYRASEIGLDGEDAPSRHSINWFNLPAGSYTFVATLHGPDGPRATVTQQIRVIDGGETLR